MEQAGTRLDYTGTLIVTSCGVCRVRFAIPSDMHQALVRTQEFFWCPNGDKIHYYGKTTEQQERERRERAEARERHLQDQLRATERSLRATKGVVTRTKNRIGKGVCPCCNRHFSNVERHMASQHPDYSESK